MAITAKDFAGAVGAISELLPYAKRPSVEAQLLLWTTLPPKVQEDHLLLQDLITVTAITTDPLRRGLHLEDTMNGPRRMATLKMEVITAPNMTSMMMHQRLGEGNIMEAAAVVVDPAMSLVRPITTTVMQYRMEATTLPARTKRVTSMVAILTISTGLTMTLTIRILKTTMSTVREILIPGKSMGPEEMNTDLILVVTMAQNLEVVSIMLEASLKILTMTTLKTLKDFSSRN